MKIQNYMFNQITDRGHCLFGIKFKKKKISVTNNLQILLG